MQDASRGGEGKFRGNPHSAPTRGISLTRPLAGLLLCLVVLLTLGIRFTIDAGPASSGDPAMTATPTVTALGPDVGSPAGATVTTVSGTGFVPGETTVDFGATPATEVKVTSPGSLTATAPAGVPGSVDVTVQVASQDGLSSPTSAADLFAYGAPMVSSVMPDSGPRSGGTMVTISGSGFTPGSTVSFGSVVATNVTVMSGTTLTVPAPPAAAPGTVDVTVADPGVGGGSSAASPADHFAYGVPAITSISPDTGSAAGGDTVTILGSSFQPGATVSFGGVAAPKVDVSATGTSMAVATPPGTDGSVHVTVSDPSGTSLATVNDLYAYGAPAVHGVAPAAGPATGGQDVIIGGTGFVAGTTVRFGDVTATSVTVLEGGTGLVAVAPPGSPGPVNMRVTTPAGTSPVWSGDMYMYGLAAVTGISPATGSTAGGTAVTVTGSGFVQGCKVSFGLFPATSVTVTSPTSLVAVSPAGNAGTIPVRVSTPAGLSPVSDSGQFTYGG